MIAPCPDKRLLLNADLDGELDAGRSAELAAHVQGCAGCAALRDALQEQRVSIASDTVYHRAPERLRRSLAPPRPVGWKFPVGFAAGALAASLALIFWPHAPGFGPPDQLLASHLRALQPGHLMDVASNDLHNVKPWFDGRLDFAPPVKDLSAGGFVLAGGRLDYLAGRPVAVLVYRRELHVIDLYVRPGGGGGGQTRLSGYNIMSWAQAGFAFTAVSDLNAAELRLFATRFQAAP